MAIFIIILIRGLVKVEDLNEELLLKEQRSVRSALRFLLKYLVFAGA